MEEWECRRCEQVLVKSWQPGLARHTCSPRPWRPAPCAHVQWMGSAIGPTASRLLRHSPLLSFVSSLLSLLISCSWSSSSRTNSFAFLLVVNYFYIASVLLTRITLWARLQLVTTRNFLHGISWTRVIVVWHLSPPYVSGTLLTWLSNLKLKHVATSFRLLSKKDNGLEVIADFLARSDRQKGRFRQDTTWVSRCA